MTKFKKIIPALCMLLISAVLMGTSTYAWFSMNTTVSAGGMKVTANSNNLFLQISASTTFTDPATSVDFADENATALKPATPILAAANASIQKWQTATSDNPANATSGATQTDVESANLSQYVYSKTLYFKIAAGSTATASDLVITGVTMTGGTTSGANLNKSLRVAVVGEGGGVQVWTNTTGTWAKDTAKSADTILDSVTTEATQATLYIWFEGTDAACITNNVVGLSDLEFTVTFGVTAA